MCQDGANLGRDKEMFSSRFQMCHFAGGCSHPPITTPRLGTQEQVTPDPLLPALKQVLQHHSDSKLILRALAALSEAPSAGYDEMLYEALTRLTIVLLSKLPLS